MDTSSHSEYITGAVGGIQIRLAELKREGHQTTSVDDPEHRVRVRILEILSNPNIDQAIRTLTNIAVQLRSIPEIRSAYVPEETTDWRKSGPTQ